MRATIWWFSGTGNSWLVAKEVARVLGEGGSSCALRAIEDLGKPRRRVAFARPHYPDAIDGDGIDGDGIDAIDGDGIDVFCFPVFAFTAPAIVDRFLSTLPVAFGRKAAVIVTMGGGGYEGRTLLRARRMLKESGRKLVLGAAIEMPEAFVQAAPATPPEEAEALTRAGLLEAARLGSLLLSGGEDFRAVRPGLMALCHIAVLGFRHIGRRVLGLCWSSSSACTACGLCAACCPATVITMAAGRPHWKGSCEGCQRCANLCPRGALRVSLPKLILVMVPLFLPWGRWLSRAAGTSDGLAGFLLWIAGFVAATSLVGLILWLADLVPGLRDFLSLSFAANYRRRLAPGFEAALWEKARAKGEARRRQ